jgi:hypothetical protein
MADAQGASAEGGCNRQDVATVRDLARNVIVERALEGPSTATDLDGFSRGTAGGAASGNLCGEPHSSSLQHLSSDNYGFLGSTTYSSLGSNETVLAASVVLGFLWSGGGRAHNYQRLPPCSYSAALRQHPLLRHLQFSLLLQHY